MGPGMFDGLVEGLIILGVPIGIALCGVVFGLYWLFSHISVAWV